MLKGANNPVLGVKDGSLYEKLAKRNAARETKKLGLSQGMEKLRGGTKGKEIFGVIKLHIHLMLETCPGLKSPYGLAWFECYFLPNRLIVAQSEDRLLIQDQSCCSLFSIHSKRPLNVSRETIILSGFNHFPLTMLIQDAMHSVCVSRDR